jgi:ligand-binding SRPBCC domain-containing protein
VTRSARFEQWVPVPLDRVFRFFSDPRNLPRLMPPELGARIESIAPPPPARVGTEITLSVRLLPPLPIRTPWIARIVELVPGSHFADVQVKGPFRAWRHRHGFEAALRDGTDGTIVRDEVEFELGFGPLGDAAARLLVGPRLEATFAERQRRLSILLDGR